MPIKRLTPFILAGFLGISVFATEPKPNIVYILADDLGYGDVQCLNPQRGKIKTPNLDQLAAQSMTFTDSHSGSSVCTPTRYGVLTGRYAWRTRLQRGVMGIDQAPLIASDRLTVEKLLQDQGYHTACVGKWHLGFNLDQSANKPERKQRATPNDMEKRFQGLALGTTTRNGPLTRGFDQFYGFHHAASIRALFLDDRVIEDVDPVAMLPKLTLFSTKYVMDRSKTGRPFFLYLALNSPHAPIVPGKNWQGKSGIGDYGDYVMETDWAVGEVLKAIDLAGIADNTLVIFTSDNGCSGPAAHTDQLEKLGHFASERFRGYKSDIWEGGHRVPFMVQWPGRVKSGIRNNATICHTDFMATVAEIIGVRLPENAAEDSFSLLAELLGNGHSARTSTIHHSISGKFAIREGSWKLEFCPGSGGWSQPKDADAQKIGLPAVQLYDLAQDIGETRNLWQERPGVATRLTAELEKQITAGRSTPGAPQKNDVFVKLPIHTTL